MSQHKLVIAEKPSVAQVIAAVLGVKKRSDGYLESNEYYISWCYGHLLELYQPHEYDEKLKSWRIEDLPIIPTAWQYNVLPDKKKQFSVLKKLMNEKSVDMVICATDAAREGERIFRLVYQQAKCNKPIKRLWISSMEDAAILAGFDNLKDGSAYDNLFASAECRAKADWLVGMNLSRLFTKVYQPSDRSLDVGRVLTPTLAMLVERHKAITAFIKEPYYKVDLHCEGFTASSDRINERQAADTLAAKCQGIDVALSEIQREVKSVHPPKLYDLTTLQREANRLYGFTAEETLNYVQALYEKKLATYPRTDSQYITEDMKGTAEHMVNIILAVLPFATGMEVAPDTSRIINNEKVSDHHAIIPTGEIASADLSALPLGEKKTLELIAHKLLCAVSAVHQYETVTANFICAGSSFSAKGKSIVTPGWKDIEAAFKAATGADKEKDNDAPLPLLHEGDTFQAAAKVSVHSTSPPKPYTEDTLLSAMERAGSQDYADLEDTEKKGLGTPATRADILEKMIRKGFAVREKKNLIPTQNGVNLISVLPDTVCSAKLTAEWEHLLQQIERGQYSPQKFMDGIQQMIQSYVTEYAGKAVDNTLFHSAAAEKETVGPCPRCGNPVHESKSNFYCSNRDCGFFLLKAAPFFSKQKKAITKKMAADFLTKGETQVKGLCSPKTGKTYDATIIMVDTGDKYVNFGFPEKK